MSDRMIVSVPAPTANSDFHVGSPGHRFGAGDVHAATPLPSGGKAAGSLVFAVVVATVAITGARFLGLTGSQFVPITQPVEDAS